MAFLLSVLLWQKVENSECLCAFQYHSSHKAPVFTNGASTQRIFSNPYHLPDISLLNSTAGLSILLLFLLKFLFVWLNYTKWWDVLRNLSMYITNFNDTLFSLLPLFPPLPGSFFFLRTSFYLSILQTYILHVRENTRCFFLISLLDAWASLSPWVFPATDDTGIRAPLKSFSLPNHTYLGLG